MLASHSRAIGALRTLIAGGALLAMTACGGGGSSGTSPVPNSGYCGNDTQYALANPQSGGNISFGSLDTLLLLLAPITWALGSVLSRRLPLAPGLMNTSIQMLFAGVVMIFIAFLRGEHLYRPLDARTVAALLYLVVFGSMIAFSAYGYLLRTVRPALATSYAYVNPLVALVIEPKTTR